MSTASDSEFAARPQLSDDVARYVRRRIFTGGYRPGEYLRLEQLAGELGISVTPVREALLNLRAEGLLAQHPRRGFMVLEVTARDLADVAKVQAFIGGELAARAAEHITDAILDALGVPQVEDVPLDDDDDNEDDDDDAEQDENALPPGMSRALAGRIQEVHGKPVDAVLDRWTAAYLAN